ncbi:hypothetical protein ILYODFUR_026744 [Ilyodon furcidens]|uniref:Uncharacterized protein n=1 Tax=Ilyodon furcidens TaxID=33524 RepID=A0ABV0TPT9_9TELE
MWEKAQFPSNEWNGIHILQCRLKELRLQVQCGLALSGIGQSQITGPLSFSSLFFRRGTHPGQHFTPCQISYKRFVIPKLSLQANFAPHYVHHLSVTGASAGCGDRKSDLIITTPNNIEALSGSCL